MEHLLEAHSVAPRMSPDAFAQHEVLPGVNSYAKLASALGFVTNKSPLSVVDLACGDGHLIPYVFRFCEGAQQTLSSLVGIDMSPNELALAKQAFAADRRVHFLEETAQHISLPDASVDAVLCHMAFMLMLPVEPVVEHILRILKPNGIFSAIVPDPTRISPEFKFYQNLIADFFKSEYPQMTRGKTGDSRTESRAGLEELFGVRSARTVIAESKDLSLKVCTSAEEAWDYWKNTYYIGLLPSEKKQLLQARLISAAKQRADSEGNVRFELPMWQFIVRKRSLP